MAVWLSSQLEVDRECDALHDGIILNAQHRSFFAEARLFDTAKGNDVLRDHASFDTDHADFQCFTYTEAAADILAEEVATETDADVVCTLDHILFVFKAVEHRKRTKRLFFVRRLRLVF